MSEIEKMYKNCGIEIPIAILKNFKDDNGEIFTRPPFTAEKQLEIIKWLTNKFSFFAIEFNFNEWSSSNGLISGFYKKSLEESIADYINSLWQYLADTEKSEIKRILE